MSGPFLPGYDERQKKMDRCCESEPDKKIWKIETNPGAFGDEHFKRLFMEAYERDRDAGTGVNEHE